MKKIYKWTFIATVCISLLSCKKESSLVNPNNSESGPRSSFSTSAVSNLHPTAIEYYNNVKTIMYGTNAFQRPNSNVSYENLMDNDSTFNENPMSLRLQSLELVDEYDQRIDPFEFTTYEKNRFVNELLRSECEIMSERFISAPQVLQEVENENIITSQVIMDEGLTKQEFYDKFELAPIGLKDDIQNDIKTVDYQTFFRKLHSALEQGKNISNASSKGIVIGGDGPIIYWPEAIVDFWAAHSTPGAIVLALPKHNEPWVFLSTENPFMVGHSAIITKKIHSNTRPSEMATLECDMKAGVSEYSLSRWNLPHYILGLQNVKRKWSFRKWKIITEITPIQDLSPMIYQAQQHIGKKYVTVLEFLVAKLAAPHRFTCTTYVWWCAKKAFGINISNWYAPMITPSAIYLNEHTYVINDIHTQK